MNDKLTKGYICPEAKKREGGGKGEEGVVRKGEKKGRHFSGEYYEKGKESIKLEVNGKKVKVTKVSEDGKEGFEIRSFESNEEAISYCL